MGTPTADLLEAIAVKIADVKDLDLKKGITPIDRRDSINLIRTKIIPDLQNILGQLYRVDLKLTIARKEADDE